MGLKASFMIRGYKHYSLINRYAEKILDCLSVLLDVIDICLF